MKPRLLDLFSGAGGAAVGYARAGFEVVGVDHVAQPNYPFKFVQDDALELLSTFTPSVNGWWDEPPFDAIHASPPCQRFSIAQSASGNAEAHPDLVAPVRALLVATGLPYVIENVPGAPLINPVTICGKSLGLGVKRHRLFETSFPLLVPPCRDHGKIVSVFGGGSKGQRNPSTGKREFVPYELAKEAMGIDWMTRDELAQAIPPAYTELIGHQLMQHLQAVAA